MSCDGVYDDGVKQRGEGRILVHTYGDGEVRMRAGGSMHIPLVVGTEDLDPFD